MSETEIALALTNYRRSWLAVAEAFIAAAGHAVDNDERPELGAQLERELATRDAAIDFIALDLAMTAIVGLLAAKSGVTPRYVLERHFEAAPTDAMWGKLIDAGIERRQKETDE